MEEKIQSLLRFVQDKVEFDQAEILNKGYSKAIKYILYHLGEPLYLLRVYDEKSYTRRLEEYKYLKLHFDNGVKCQKPIHIELLQDLKLCYLLLPYIEGESGEEIIPYLKLSTQYQEGLTAGKELKKIHKVVPDTPINWFERRYDKYIQKKMKVKELGVNFHRQSYIESYIDDQFDLLSDSLVSFQHDDFHPPNMIFRNGKFVGVIDFCRFDWGDPWEEFFKLPKYTCDISNHFAYGQVLGYFEGNVPDIFWAKYNLFVALNFHASIIGGHQNQKTKEMLNKIDFTIETHDFSNGGPPKWFLESMTESQ